MRGQGSRVVLVAALVVLLASVSGSGVGDGSGEAVPVLFTKVELPAGAAPVVLSIAGDGVLIGVRRDGQPVVPGLLRRGPNGVITDIAVHGASPYGLEATWLSIASDGGNVLAVGGERGGAHGNVRWSVWNGSAAGITEKPQGFSTFGGWGAGDLIDGVLTPAGPALIGTWQSAQVGLDIAVWTFDGEVWTRQSSAGTALENRRDALGFPLAATALQRGVLVVGGQLASVAGESRQLPVVWRSNSGASGWTSSALPESGRSGTAMAVGCWGSTCGVAGRVEDKLAVWRLADGAWVRVAGVPPIAVGYRDRLVAPIEVDGHLTQVVSDGGQVKIARADGDRWTVRGAAGPTGTVTAVTSVGGTIFVLAGPDENAQTLWRTDAGSIH